MILSTMDFLTFFVRFGTIFAHVSRPTTTARTTRTRKLLLEPLIERFSRSKSHDLLFDNPSVPILNIFLDNEGKGKTN